MPRLARYMKRCESATKRWVTHVGELTSYILNTRRDTSLHEHIEDIRNKNFRPDICQLYGAFLFVSSQSASAINPTDPTYRIRGPIKNTDK